MKIVKHGKSPPILTGTCQHCRCRIECTESETKWVVDRDSPAGMRHVKCPECTNEYLWVSEKKK